MKTNELLRGKPRGIERQDHAGLVLASTLTSGFRRLPWSLIQGSPEGQFQSNDTQIKFNII